MIFSKDCVVTLEPESGFGRLPPASLLLHDVLEMNEREFVLLVFGIQHNEPVSVLIELNRSIDRKNDCILAHFRPGKAGFGCLHDNNVGASRDRNGRRVRRLAASPPVPLLYALEVL